MPAPSQKGSIQSNDLQVELAAMRKISAVLNRLDEPTCARVLHWITERFQGAAPVVTQPAPLHAVPGPLPSPAPDQAEDEALSISALTDYFDRRPLKAVKKPAAEAPPQSVNGMLHDFVTEFQDVVRDWNVACDGPADGRTVESDRSIAS